jgi:hypothetical protein
MAVVRLAWQWVEGFTLSLVCLLRGFSPHIHLKKMKFKSKDNFLPPFHLIAFILSDFIPV